ncbi:MAG: QueG-associated DUF1730 domain-containing protein [Kiritimatiellia bacterium]
MAPAPLRDRLDAAARDLGLDAFGVAPAEASPRADDLLAHLAAGRHADMEWLARDPHRRADPRLVLPGARSVIVVALSYFTADPPPGLWDDPLRGRVARYAWGRDYHNVLGSSSASSPSCSRAAPGANWRAYADTGPVMEHDTALRAGLGFTGKNTASPPPLARILSPPRRHPDRRRLDPDPPAATDGGAVWRKGTALRSCGSCIKCQDACPTRAFPSPTSSTPAAASPTTPSKIAATFPRTCAPVSATGSSAATNASPSAHGSVNFPPAATPATSNPIPNAWPPPCPTSSPSTTTPSSAATPARPSCAPSAAAFSATPSSPSATPPPRSPPPRPRPRLQPRPPPRLSRRLGRAEVGRINVG